MGPVTAGVGSCSVAQLPRLHAIQAAGLDGALRPVGACSDCTCETGVLVEAQSGTGRAAIFAERSGERKPRAVRGAARSERSSGAGGLKAHAPLDDRAVLLELVHGPIQTGGVDSKFLGDLAHGDARTLMDQMQDVLLSTRRAARTGPPIARRAPRRACPPRRDRRLGRRRLPARVTRRHGCPRLGRRGASATPSLGRRGPPLTGGRGVIVEAQPRRWAICSSSWYSAASGLSSRRRLATSCSAVRN
jgi:hypothetical protein